MIRVLAENDFGDNIGDGLAGPMGLLIIVLMVIATVFLMRNMNQRLRRLPQRFPNPPDAPDRPAGTLRSSLPSARTAADGAAGPPDTGPAGSVIEAGRTDPGSAGADTL